MPKQSSRAAGSFSEVKGLNSGPGNSPDAPVEKLLAHPERAAYIDPDVETLREELIDASLLNGRLERQIDTSVTELARVQQQLKAATDECERLTASATHAQAELKTFQNERQQLKADLTSARQRLTAAETQLGERETEINQTKVQLETLTSEHGAAQSEVATHLATLAELQGAREELNGHLASAREQLTLRAAELAETTQRLTARDETLAERDHALAQLRAESGEKIQQFEATLGALRQDLENTANERADLRRQLEEALPQVEEGRKHRSQLSQTEDELLSTLEKLQTAETAAKSVQQELEAQRKETDSLRQNLAANDVGRELLEVREHLTQTEAERERWLARASVLETDLQIVRDAQETLQTRAESFRQQQEETAQKLEAISQTKVMQDNEVLRGIVARQNSELAQQHGELYRLKRARYVLKIVYTLFGLGLLGVVAFACKILAHVKL